MSRVRILTFHEKKGQIRRRQAVVCANTFGAIVLKPRFKIDTVIMIICSIVIIINSVLTLQVFDR
jgi:hypothetical protein